MYYGTALTCVYSDCDSQLALVLLCLDIVRTQLSVSSMCSQAHHSLVATADPSTAPPLSLGVDRAFHV